MPHRHGAGAAVKAKTSGFNRLAGNDIKESKVYGLYGNSHSGRFRGDAR